MKDIQNVIAAANIRYDKDSETLFIIDQTLLPGEEREIPLGTAEEMYEAVKALRVRGAPAIGICAAYCLYVLSRSIPEGEDFQARLEAYADYLVSARHNAVNLSWSSRAMV